MRLIIRYIYHTCGCLYSTIQNYDVVWQVADKQLFFLIYEYSIKWLIIIFKSFIIHSNIIYINYWVRHLRFFFQLVLILWTLRLSSCLIWQIISFNLPPNEYGCVYAWTTLGNIATLLWKSLRTDFGRREAPSAPYISVILLKSERNWQPHR